jgi:hypothetical protein
MKRALLGALVCIGLVLTVGAGGDRNEALTQRATPAGAAPANPILSSPAAVAGNDLIVVPTMTADRGQMLTVVDPRNKVIGVYHIDATGKIELRGVRNISCDLQLMYLNNSGLLPLEIQSMLQKK